MHPSGFRLALGRHLCYTILSRGAYTALAIASPVAGTGRGFFIQVGG